MIHRLVITKILISQISQQKRCTKTSFSEYLQLHYHLLLCQYKILLRHMSMMERVEQMIETTTNADFKLNQPPNGCKPTKCAAMQSKNSGVQDLSKCTFTYPVEGRKLHWNAAVHRHSIARRQRRNTLDVS